MAFETGCQDDASRVIDAKSVPSIHLHVAAGIALASQRHKPIYKLTTTEARKERKSSPPSLTHSLDDVQISLDLL